MYIDWSGYISLIPLKLQSCNIHKEANSRFAWYLALIPAYINHVDSSYGQQILLHVWRIVLLLFLLLPMLRQLLYVMLVEAQPFWCTNIGDFCYFWSDFHLESYQLQQLSRCLQFWCTAPKVPLVHIMLVQSMPTQSGGACVETQPALSTFAELLVGWTTQKAQQNRWMDPSKDWGQNKGLQRLESTKQRRNGNWLPPKGSIT